MEYILTFSSTNHSIAAEQTILDAKINVKVMPLPPQIKAGCGLCLRMAGANLPASLDLLKEKHINASGIFLRKLQNGKSTYEPYELGKCDE